MKIKKNSKHSSIRKKQTKRKSRFLFLLSSFILIFAIGLFIFNLKKNKSSSIDNTIKTISKSSEKVKNTAEIKEDEINEISKIESTSLKSFFISAWYGPLSQDPVQNNIYFQAIRNAGFNNIIMDTYPTSSTNLNLELTAAQNNNISLMLHDPNISLTASSLSFSQSDYYKTVDTTYGNLISDEPNYKNFKDLAKIKDQYLQNVPNKFFYVNLYPNYAAENILYGAQDPKEGTMKYEDYVRSFIKIVKPSVLSYDYYPFPSNGGVNTGYLQNIQFMATEAKMKNLPLWITIQAIGNEGSLRQPNTEDIRWQIFSSLAYGVQGISYFSYGSPQAFGASMYGLIDSKRNQTPLYSAAKNVNTEIRSFEKVFLNYKWEGTLVYSPKTQTANTITENIAQLKGQIKSTPRIKSYSSDRSILIGTFKNDDNKYNKDAFMITNFEEDNLSPANNLSITLKNAKRALIYISGEKKIIDLKEGKLNLTLEAGQGVYAVPLTY
ncbi:MAG: hypothetical protein LBI13_02310 [Streptococcaceae bacterium]|jgi:hypothetical protein|nr:hypothetical protein [Streptococcaceae bacterium]